MSNAVRITDEDKKALRADDTRDLKTEPGTERVVADLEPAEPVEHLSGRSADRFRRKPSVDQVAIDTIQNAD